MTLLRLILILLPLLLPGLFAAGLPALAQPVAVFSQTVPLVAGKPSRLRAGLLVYRGGIALRSNDRRFGGFSGLHVNASGNTVLAVSDRGAWLRVRLVHDKTGVLTGVTGAEMGPLRGPDGKPMAGRAGDAEALAVLPDGSALVAFERRHRLLLYPPSPSPFAGRPRPYPLPRAVLTGPANGGLETLVHVGRGYLLTISERQRSGPKAVLAWVGVDGGWQSLAYRRPAGFHPTDGALLPNGDILILERRFLLGQGNAIRLMRVPRRQIAPGRTLRPRLIARLESPMTVDNFEGVAVRPADDGGALIYLISDNNFSPLQRTLLLTFALPPAP